MKIEVHSKNDCPYCKLAKEYLTEKGIVYDEIVYDDIDDRQRLYDMLGLEGNKRTVPQVILVEADGERKRIGGYHELIVSDVADRWSAGNFDEDF